MPDLCAEVNAILKQGRKKKGDLEWALLDLNSGFKFSEVRVQIIKSAAV